MLNLADSQILQDAESAVSSDEAIEALEGRPHE